MTYSSQRLDFSCILSLHMIYDSLFQWHASKSSYTKSVVLMCHGLTLKPERLHSIIEEFNKRNISVLNMALTGHRQNADSKKSTSNLWLDEFFKAYTIAKNKADELNVDLHFLGYSTGALCASLLEIQSKVSFKRKVFLAPALEMKPLSFGMKYFAYLFPFYSITHTSADGIAYDFHMNGYKAFFSLLKNFQQTKTSIKNSPTLIFMREKDEIVSYKKLMDFIEKKNLNNWQIRKFSENPKTKCHHFCFSKDTIHENDWINFIKETCSYLNEINDVDFSKAYFLSQEISL